jgi:uncharacterized protein YukE
MATRVLSSDTGRASITRIQSILAGGLSEQIAALQVEGETLSDPSVWDGMRAEEFRGSTWPAASSGLRQAAEALAELQRQVQTINSDIMAAGGNA